MNLSNTEYWDLAFDFAIYGPTTLDKVVYGEEFIDSAIKAIQKYWEEQTVLEQVEAIANEKKALKMQILNQK